jgi:hypothetical protein
MATTDQMRAARLLRLTDRRLRQLEREEGAPLRLANGRYPTAALLRWDLVRRLRKDRGESAVRLYELGEAHGEGAALHQLRAELFEILGVADEPPPPVDGYTFERVIADERRELVAAMRERAEGADAATMRAIVVEYIDAALYGPGE